MNNIETIRDQTVPEAKFRMAEQFNRLVALDVINDEYLTALNERENDYKPEFIEATNTTTFLIRRSLFASFMDILDFGSTDLLKSACAVLEATTKYKKREIPAISIEMHPEDGMREIVNFGKDLQALEYKRNYM